MMKRTKLKDGRECLTDTNIKTYFGGMVPAMKAGKVVTERVRVNGKMVDEPVMVEKRVPVKSDMVMCSIMGKDGKFQNWYPIAKAKIADDE